MCESYNGNMSDTLTERELAFQRQSRDVGQRLEGLSSFKDGITIPERVIEALGGGTGRYIETRETVLSPAVSPNNLLTLVPGLSDEMLFENLVLEGYLRQRGEVLPAHTVVRLPEYGPEIARVGSRLESVTAYSQEAQDIFLETYLRYGQRGEFRRYVDTLRETIDRIESGETLGVIVVTDFKDTGHTELMTVSTALRALELSRRLSVVDFGQFMDRFHRDLFSHEALRQVHVADLGQGVRLARVTLGEVSWLEEIISASFPDLLHYREKTMMIIKPLLRSILRGSYKTAESGIREIRTERDIDNVGWEISRPRPYIKETENPAAIIRSYCRERGIDFSSLLGLHGELAEKIRAIGKNTDI
jgi:hypothetical protein